MRTFYFRTEIWFDCATSVCAHFGRSARSFRQRLRRHHCGLNGPVISLVFHAVPNHNPFCDRGCRLWWRRWRWRWHLYVYSRRRRRRYLLWWPPKIIFRDPMNRLRIGLCWLPQHERKPPDVSRQQDFLGLFRTELESDRLGNRRLFGPFAGNLINGQDLGVLQDHIRVTLFKFRFGLGTN